MSCPRPTASTEPAANCARSRQTASGTPLIMGESEFEIRRSRLFQAGASELLAAEDKSLWRTIVRRRFAREPIRHPVHGRDRAGLGGAAVTDVRQDHHLHL